jgi:isopentenyl-diphosphate delta-isomerase
MEEDELLDLVDRNDQVVGTVMRYTHHENSDEYTSKGLFWRGTGCFLVNSKGELWIPRRQPNRQVAPNGLDFSMAEHVQSGETFEQAAVRGMAEELNLNLKPKDLHSLGKKIFPAFGAIMSVFIYQTDEDPDYSKADYQDAWWISLDQLRDKLNQKSEKYKDALPEWLSDVEKYINEKL